MNSYDIARVKRAIAVNGLPFDIGRYQKDKYGKEDDTLIFVCSGKGLFHSPNGFLNISLQEKGKIESKKQPKILLAYNDKVRLGDNITINKKSYSIAGIDNLGELNLFLDLSLKVVE